MDKFMIIFYGEKLFLHYRKNCLYVKIDEHSFEYDKDISMKDLLKDLEEWMEKDDEFVFEHRG